MLAILVNYSLFDVVATGYKILDTGYWILDIEDSNYS